jgi:hypothetical protein
VVQACVAIHHGHDPREMVGDLVDQMEPNRPSTTTENDDYSVLPLYLLLNISVKHQFGVSVDLVHKKKT